MRYPRRCYEALRAWEKKKGIKLKGKSRKRFLENMAMLFRIKYLIGLEYPKKKRGGRGGKRAKNKR